MRWCRNPLCRQAFRPAKDFYVYCSWACRVAHVGEDYTRDSQGYQRGREQAYDGGFWDGTRLHPPPVAIPSGIWKGLMLFSHPDKWQSEPGLLPLASEITRWLLDHRPSEERRGR
jgi:hypothetical protein